MRALLPLRLVAAAYALALCCGLSAAAVDAPAADPATARRILTPAQIARLAPVPAGPGTSGVASIRMTVLYGNPTASGPYTIALDVPPGVRIKPHTHRDPRSVVVVRGAWRFGYGTSLDDRALTTLGPGSFYTEPAGEAHFATTGAAGATVYISGWGPTDTHYLE